MRAAHGVCESRVYDLTQLTKIKTPGEGTITCTSVKPQLLPSYWSWLYGQFNEVKDSCMPTGLRLGAVIHDGEKEGRLSCYNVSL